MNTNAAILLKQGQMVKGIEVGNNGEPEHIGPYLLKVYNTVERIQALISLGDIQEIGINMPDNAFVRKLNQDIKQMQADILLSKRIKDYIKYSFEEKGMVQVYTAWDKHEQKKFNSLEDIIIYRPKSIYVYDAFKREWLIGLWRKSRQPNEDKETLRFMRLKDYLSGNPTVGWMIEYTGNKNRRLLDYVRGQVESKIKEPKTITPRMIVMQANKEFMERGIQAKLSYTAKDIGQMPRLVVFIRTSNGRPISKSCVPSELIKELRTRGLSRAYKLVKEYERQNSLTDSISQMYINFKSI